MPRASSLFLDDLCFSRADHPVVRVRGESLSPPMRVSGEKGREREDLREELEGARCYARRGRRVGREERAMVASGGFRHDGGRQTRFGVLGVGRTGCWETCAVVGSEIVSGGGGQSLGRRAVFPVSCCG